MPQVMARSWNKVAPISFICQFTKQETGTHRPIPILVLLTSVFSGRECSSIFCPAKPNSRSGKRTRLSFSVAKSAARSEPGPLSNRRRLNNNFGIFSLPCDSNIIKIRSPNFQLGNFVGSQKIKSCVYRVCIILDHASRPDLCNLRSDGPSSLFVLEGEGKKDSFFSLFTRPPTSALSADRRLRPLTPLVARWY